MHARRRFSGEVTKVEERGQRDSAAEALGVSRRRADPRRHLLLGREETARLLRKYWSIPERQIETSVVLASPGFHQCSGGVVGQPQITLVQGLDWVSYHWAARQPPTTTDNHRQPLHGTHGSMKTVPQPTPPQPSEPPQRVVPYRLPAASRVSPPRGCCPSEGSSAKSCNSA